MSIYTGFFDASFNEVSGTYDHEYDSADFTSYFGEMIGSGVCVYNNDDSMRVYYDAASKRAVINPGYLFIRGYWLKNDGLYTVSLDSLPAGIYAIYAELNLGSRGIRIAQKAKVDPEIYPDALVLAYATIDESSIVTIEDTRSRTDICGLIDSAGSLTAKIEYAINYIDHEIENKLDQIEQDLQEKEAEIDGKIEEANAMIAQIAPPAIGTIKFSASSKIENGWIKCDGSFISESEYPDLVTALGKLTPSADKFQLIDFDGSIPSSGISNFVLYDGILWTYCPATKILYGIPVDGGALKTITVSSEDTRINNFITPSFENPLALSIVPRKAGAGARIFLAQIFADGQCIQPVNDEYSSEKLPDDMENATETSFLSQLQIFVADFVSASDSLKMTLAVQSIAKGKTESVAASKWRYYTARSNRVAIPYVTSVLQNDAEIYYCAVGERISYAPSDDVNKYRYYNTAILTWSDNSTNGDIVEHDIDGELTDTMTPKGCAKFGFSDKNKGEVVTIGFSRRSPDITCKIYSFPQGIFTSESVTTRDLELLNVNMPMAIAGNDKTLFSFDKNNINWLSRLDERIYTLPNPVSVPSMARTFLDAGQYLFDKDIYFVFVGTGIIFSRNFDSENSVGYLDTTQVMGVITQYGDIRYDDQTATMYIMGQDSTNKVKAAKIVLNTLFDYANDGAWLPLIASDGVPAYIKAKESE